MPSAPAPAAPAPAAPTPSAATRGYDRSDWASAFRNVGVELDDVPLAAARGAIPRGCACRLW